MSTLAVWKWFGYFYNMKVLVSLCFVRIVFTFDYILNHLVVLDIMYNLRFKLRNVLVCLETKPQKELVGTQCDSHEIMLQ